MKNKAILLIFLFVLTYTKIYGQTVVYTYNEQGSCTSRTLKGTPRKSKEVQKTGINTKLLKVTLSPSSTLQEQVSISVVGLSSGHSLSYIMSNASGQIVFKGSIWNESIILTTADLPRGIYLVKVISDGYEKSYKLLKE